MLKTRITSILYDLDGVLIETRKWHYTALNKALKKYSFHITLEEHKKKYEGLPTLEKLKLLTKEKGLNECFYEDIISSKYNEIQKKIELDCKPDKEKISMICELKKYGFKQAICTNTTKSTVIATLKRIRLYGYFNLIMARSDILNPKPNPEIYIKTIRYLGDIPKNCLILEDSDHGYRAALKSGANVLKISDISLVTLTNIEKELNKYR